MSLTNFKIVNADGLGSVNYDGTDYPISQIDDTIAAKLYGKTHIIEKVAGPVAAVPATVTTPDGDEAAPATKSRRS